MRSWDIRNKILVPITKDQNECWHTHTYKISGECNKTKINQETMQCIFKFLLRKNKYVTDALK